VFLHVPVVLIFSHGEVPVPVDAFGCPLVLEYAPVPLPIRMTQRLIVRHARHDGNHH
jgi:hypothetical protein